MKIIHHHPDTFLDVEDTDNNLYIVNFSKLMEINIQYDLISDIKKYNCDKKIDITLKHLFYHHICLGLSEYILHLTKLKSHRTVIYYHQDDLKNLHIFEIFKDEDIRNLITKILTEIKKSLPIRILMTNYSFYYFLNADSGKKIEILSTIRSIGSDTFEKYSFQKAIKFAEKRGLVFLTNDYFQRLKTKQLMFS